MSSPVATVQADDTARLVAERMAGDQIGSVLVKDGEELLGIVTETDLTRKVLSTGKDPEALRARELMSIPVVTIEPSAHVDQALETMAEHGIRHLVVTLDGEVRGIVTVTDIARSALDLERRLQSALGTQWED